MSDFTTRFKNIETIPLPYRNIFSNFPCFNIVQSEVLDDILYTGNISYKYFVPKYLSSLCGFINFR